MTIARRPSGLKPDDVDITVENGRLTIRGEVASAERNGHGDYLVREIRRGAFSRTISLPNGLEPDKASAAFDDGVLTLRIPKAENVKPRQIRINSTTNSSSNGQRPIASSAQPATLSLAGKGD